MMRAMQEAEDELSEDEMSFQGDDLPSGSGGPQLEMDVDDSQDSDDSQGSGDEEGEAEDRAEVEDGDGGGQL